VIAALDINRDKKFMHERVFQHHREVFEQPDIENEFEELDTYLRLHIFGHLGKSMCVKPFQVLENLFCVKNLYK
jgi:hypothetical protein